MLWVPILNHYSKRLSRWQQNLWQDIMGERYQYAYAGGPKKDEFIQRAVSSFPYGTVSAAGDTGLALDTTITSMGNTIYDADSIDSWRVYGYNSGVDYYSYGNFGTIGSATYTDGGGSSRTISAIYYHEPGSPNARADDLVLSLNATGIGDTDTTFVSLEYNGVEYTRSSRTLYSGTFGSASSWIWQNINPNGPTTGNPTVKIFI